MSRDIRIDVFLSDKTGWTYLVTPLGKSMPLMAAGGFADGDEALARARQWASHLNIVGERVDPFFAARERSRHDGEGAQPT